MVSHRGFHPLVAASSVSPIGLSERLRLRLWRLRLWRSLRRLWTAGRLACHRLWWRRRRRRSSGSQLVGPLAASALTCARRDRKRLRWRWLWRRAVGQRLHACACRLQFRRQRLAPALILSDFPHAWHCRARWRRRRRWGHWRQPRCRRRRQGRGLAADGALLMTRARPVAKRAKRAARPLRGSSGEGAPSESSIRSRARGRWQAAGGRQIAIAMWSVIIM